MDVLARGFRMGGRRSTWANSRACGTAGAGSLVGSRRTSGVVGAYMRPIVRYVLLFLVLCQAAGCGDSTAPTAPTALPLTQVVGNRAPSASGAIPAQTLAVDGVAATMDAASYFVDPDGDTLTYAAVSSDAAVTTASISGSTVMALPFKGSLPIKPSACPITLIDRLAWRDLP